jgi:hypothetical protein
MKFESAATKRAMYKNSDWFCSFKYKAAPGLGLEEGVHRRDPSSVIYANGQYYVWYTRSTGASVGFGTGDLEAKVFPWDLADVWYATSTDGINWQEQGLAVGRGERGSYDDRSVFTPEILAHEGKYYLVYQVVQHPYLRRVKEYIAMSIADSPDGPWRKTDAPIVRTADNGEWFGEEDNRFMVKRKGDFDSHKVHDPCLLHYQGKFWLYYKGEPMGEEMFYGGRETKWGVAIADHPEGPYEKSPYNPVTNSGHETLVWKYRDGVAALLTTDGPEKNTIQFAPDGINFEIEAVINQPPVAAGPFRAPEPIQYPLDGIRWGLCHDLSQKWGFIRRFEISEERKHQFLNKVTYE